MRRITAHRLEPAGFDDAARGLVQNAPWWLISLVVHAIALFILATIPVSVTRPAATAHLVATLPEKLETPEQVEDEPPPPELPPETIDEHPVVDPDDQPPADEADSDVPDTMNDLGDVDSALEAPFFSSAIGLGPGAGGGRTGGGGRRKGHGYQRSGLHDDAVELGLKWLADHQDVEEDGRWDCDNFMKHDPPGNRCTGPGAALHDVGVSGLALLAFLGAGYTDRGGPGKRFAKTVRKGLRYLIGVQDQDGLFGSRAHHNFIYDHAIATLAMCEAYWMTGNPMYRVPAQRGLNFLVMARNPYMAWRYQPRGGDNDTSVTGWCVMALKSGKFAGLEVDPSAFEGARNWIERMTDPQFGQVGYDFPGGSPSRPEGRQDRFPPEKSQSMTAVGVLTRIFLGEDPRNSQVIKDGAGLCAETPPVWNPDDGSIDMYYWYYGTLALFQVGGAHWNSWNRAMGTSIVKNQHPKEGGPYAGSWDPIGVWGDDGGRVYSTAMLVMCLEVYYRYDRVFGAR